MQQTRDYLAIYAARMVTRLNGILINGGIYIYIYAYIQICMYAYEWDISNNSLWSFFGIWYIT